MQWLISLLASWAGRVGIGLLLSSLLGLGGFTWVKLHDAKVRTEALALCPPQTVNTGQVTINQIPPKKMICFPIPALKGWGLGVCHD